MAATRRANFTTEETWALITIWGEFVMEKKFEGFSRHSVIWEEISEKLAEEQQFYRSGQECQKRIANVKTEYNKIKRNRILGSPEPQWPFWSSFNEVITSTSTGENIITSDDSLDHQQSSDTHNDETNIPNNENSNEDHVEHLLTKARPHTIITTEYSDQEDGCSNDEDGTDHSERGHSMDDNDNATTFQRHTISTKQKRQKRTGNDDKTEEYLHKLLLLSEKAEKRAEERHGREMEMMEAITDYYNSQTAVLTQSENSDSPAIVQNNILDNQHTPVKRTRTSIEKRSSNSHKLSPVGQNFIILPPCFNFDNKPQSK